MIRLMAFAAFALAVATSGAGHVARAASSVGRHDHASPRRAAVPAITWSMVAAIVLPSPERRQVCGWNAHSRWPLRQIIECTWRQLGVGFGRRPFTFRGQSRAGCDTSAIACEAIEGYSRSWPFVLPNVLWQTQPRSLPGLFNAPTFEGQWMVVN